MRGPRLPRLRSRRAFTLLELIVVLVVLGLLAAIAIPTYQGVIERAEDEVTLASVSSVLRGASANAGIERRDVFTLDDLETAGDEVGDVEAAAVPGETAADVAWVMNLEPTEWSDVYGKMHAGISGDEVTAGIAARTPAGRCAFARNYVGGRVEAWISTDDIGEDCSYQSAIAGVGAPSGGGGSGGPDGAPGMPIIDWADSGNAWFNLEWLEPADTGDTPITHYELDVEGPGFDLDVDVPNSGYPRFSVYAETDFVEWSNYDDVTFDGSWYDNDTLGEILNDEDYTITIRAVNDAGAGPAADQTLTPSDFVPVQEEPDPPVFITETAGYSGPDGSEVLWIDATWDPPVYEGTSAITEYHVTLTGPSTLYTVTVPAAEARHVRVEGTTFTWGDAGSQAIGTAVQPEQTYTFDVVAFNDDGNSLPATSFINAVTLPVWEPPTFVVDDPDDLTGATDGGWPAVQQVIIRRRVDQAPAWRYYRVGGGVTNVELTEAEWSTDGGNNWVSEGNLFPAMTFSGTRWVYQPPAPFHLNRSDTFECVSGLTYTPQAWSPAGDLGGNPDTVAGLGTVADFGGGRVGIFQMAEPFPNDSADGEFRVRFRYTYDNLSGPGQGEGTAIVIFDATRTPSNTTPVNQFPADGEVC